MQTQPVTYGQIDQIACKNEVSSQKMIQTSWNLLFFGNHVIPLCQHRQHRHLGHPATHRAAFMKSGAATAAWRDFLDGGQRACEVGALGVGRLGKPLGNHHIYPLVN